MEQNVGAAPGQARNSTWIPVWLGAGSNDVRADAFLEQALMALDAMDGLKLAAVSPVYETEPQDYQDQPFFKNQVVEARCRVEEEPAALMRRLLALEARLGRRRSPDPALRYGPRVIDIDMLLMGQDGAVVSADPVCLLPHPRLTRRAFWLVPLRDIAPRLRIQGESADAWLARLSWRLEGRVIYQEQPGPSGA